MNYFKHIKFKKYEQIRAHCRELVPEGWGLSFIETEARQLFTGFVWGVLPGESFVMQIRKLTSKCFYGVLVPIEDLLEDFQEDVQQGAFQHEKWALYEVSHQRVKEACQTFVTCGGCRLLHLPYEETLEIKKKWFLSQLNGSKIEAPDIKIVASPQQYHYRNHVQVHINKNKERGFYSPMTYRTIPFPDEGCLLFDQTNFDLAFPEELALERCVRGRFSEGKGKGKNEVSITSLYSKADKESKFCYEIEFPKGEVTKITIPNTAFFQVNSAFLPIWLEKINDCLDQIKTNNEIRVLELFSGFGFISKTLSLVRDIQAIGIDILKQKELRKVTFEIQEKVIETSFFDENYIQHDLIQLDQMKPDVIQKIKEFQTETVLINPPRSGFLPEQIYFLWNNILDKQTVPVIYSSCNGSTMARDLKQFIELGWKIEHLELLDFFPWTAHYEVLCFLR